MIDVVGKIGLVYLGITAIGAIAFRIEGMSTFDAIGHSMAAVATGGFSSHDASIGWFKSPAIEWTASALMVRERHAVRPAHRGAAPGTAMPCSTMRRCGCSCGSSSARW